MTNADHIRQMTDEELMDVLMCPYLWESGLRKECCEDDDACAKCFLNWLHQEYHE